MRRFAQRRGKEGRPAPGPKAPRRSRPAGDDSGAEDALQSYVAQVGRKKPLTREEEVELARAFVRNQDEQAAQRLVEGNLRLVVKLAHEYHRPPIQLLDLIQEGNLGLLQAVRKYDPERGVKLATYAGWWIRAYILRFIMENWRSVKIGTNQAERRMFYNLRREQARMAADVDLEALADRFNVSEGEVAEMDQRLGTPELSIDAPSHEGGTATLGERLAIVEASIEDRLVEEEISVRARQQIAAFAHGLDGKDRVIFEQRMLAEEPLLLGDIGERFGISRERVRQLEARLERKLRERLTAAVPELCVA